MTGVDGRTDMNDVDNELGWDLSLADAMNTYNPALVVLHEKGYWLYFVPDERPDVGGDYWAIKDQRIFTALDPLRLLGLVALWEHDGDAWQSHERSDVWSAVNDAGFAKNDFRDLDDAAFARLIEQYYPLFERLGQPLPGGVNRAEMATLVRGLTHEPEMAEADEGEPGTDQQGE